MDGGRRTDILLTVLIVMTVAAVSMSGYCLLSDESDQHYDEIRYTLFLGMGNRGPEEIQVIEDRMIDLITSTGNGYTLEHEQGGYVLDGEIRKDDVSLKFVIIDADFEDIKYIVDTFKKEFDQKLIYMEREDVIGGFF